MKTEEAFELIKKTLEEKEEEKQKHMAWRKKAI